MISDTYYLGFEGEVEIYIYYIDDKHEEFGYKIWYGYFDNILDGCLKDECKAGGLLENWSLNEGWYEQNKWKIPNLLLAIDELKGFDKEKLEINQENFILKIVEIKSELLTFFEDCSFNHREIFLDYNR